MDALLPFATAMVRIAGSTAAKHCTLRRFARRVNRPRWLTEDARRSIGTMTVKIAELNILHYPAPSLRQRARATPRIGDDVKAVAARMIELMREAKGVGLAAPQVGLPWRMFVTEVPDERQTKVYINPKLTNFSPEVSVSEEGCLSLPGIHFDIERPVEVTITALDLEGAEFSATSNAFAARVWQHEFDHLNGVLILDRVTAEQRQAHRQKLRQGKAAEALGGRLI
jgi:peptide deformylase